MKTLQLFVKALEKLLFARFKIVLKSHSVSLRIDYRTVLRFAFLIVGWADVVFSTRFIFDSAMRTVSFLFSFPNPTFVLRVVQASLGIAVILATFPGAWFLCLATAWGLKRNRAWARRTGVAACLCLLPSFPWLTAVGIVGLVAILSLQQPETAPDPVRSVSGAAPDNYWILKRESFAQAVLAFLLMNALIVAVPRSGWANFGTVAERKWELSAFVLLLFNVTIHEMGHAFIAMLLSHRVNVVCIGPCIFSKGSDGYRVQFQLKRLLAFGGYMGSVPVHSDRLRIRQIAILAAGPVASLLGGACLVAARFSTIASEKGYMLFFSWGAVLALFCFIVSIMPVGYSDGNMLAHLILKTPPGELLLEHLRLAQNQTQTSSTVPNAELQQAAAGAQEA